MTIGTMDTGRLKEAIEALTFPFGTGRTFFVVPVAYRWTSDFLLPEYGKPAGMVFTSIQNALDACESGRGDTVILCPGTHTQTAALTMSKSGVVLRGPSPELAGAVIIEGPPDAANLSTLIISGDGCTIEDLFLTPRETGVADYTIEVVASSTTLKNLTISGTCPGVRIDATAGNIDGCKLVGCNFFGTEDMLNLLASAGAVFGLLVENCKGYDLGTIGIHDTSSITNDHEQLLIKGCALHLESPGAGREYIKLDTVACTGMVTLCSFAIATNATAAFDIDTELLWVANYTEAGVTEARPA